MHNNNHTPDGGFAPWSRPWIKVRANRHLRDMFRLATPIIISRLAMFLLSIVDYALVLRYSPEQARWLTLALGATDIFLGAAIGLTIGVSVLVSRYYGAQIFHMVGKIWRQGMLWSMFTGTLLMGLVIALAPFLMRQFGDPEITSNAFPLVVIYAFSFIPAMISITGNSVLEGTEYAKPVLVISVLSNVVNVLVNLVLIYGMFGFPELGALGAAYATLSVRIFMMISTTAYILYYRHARKYNIRSFSVEPLRRWKEFTIIGMTSGLAISAESGGFAILGMLSSRLSDIQAGAYGITMRLMATIFMIGLGFSTATGIRVSIARGRKDYNDQIFALLVGVAMVTAFVVSLGVVGVIFRTSVASIFSDEVAIVGAASSLIIIALFAFVPDNLQLVFGQSLRSSGINDWPTSMDLVVFAVFMPLIGYYLLHLGAYGLMYAVVIAVWTSMLLKLSGFFLFHKRIKKYTLLGVETE